MRMSSYLASQFQTYWLLYAIAQKNGNPIWSQRIPVYDLSEGKFNVSEEENKTKLRQHKINRNGRRGRHSSSTFYNYKKKELQKWPRPLCPHQGKGILSLRKALTRRGRAGRTGTVEEVPRCAAVTTWTPFIQLWTLRNFLDSKAIYPFGADVTNYASLPTKPT